MLLRTWKYLYIFGIMISFLFGYTPTGGIALPYSSSSFNLRNLDAVFHSGCTSLHSHLQCIRIPSSSHPHQHLPHIFDSRCLNRCKVIAHTYVCICIFHIFQDLLAICMSSLAKCLCSSPILYLFILFLLSCMSSF